MRVMSLCCLLRNHLSVLAELVTLRLLLKRLRSLPVVEDSGKVPEGALSEGEKRVLPQAKGLAEQRAVVKWLKGLRPEADSLNLGGLELQAS
tara:strand:+ start:46 stop:321 length:276 start_codon:yes stop_codon:yes gene_type:complete